MYKSKQSKATDIPQKVKREVADRDHDRCIFCHSIGAPNAHYIPRSQGGLGIKENVMTACAECHRKLDSTTERKRMLEYAKKYLNRYYPNFTDEERIYRKE